MTRISADKLTTAASYTNWGVYNAAAGGWRTFSELKRYPTSPYSQNESFPVLNEQENAVSSIRMQYSHWSRNCAIGLYVLSAIWGGLQIPFPEHAGLYIFASLCFALLATLWARFDSKARGISFLSILQMLYFFVWPLGGTVYLIYRSGWRGLLTAGLHGFGMMLLMVVAFYATFYSLHFAGLLDARYYPS